MSDADKLAQLAALEEKEIEALVSLAEKRADAGLINRRGMMKVAGAGLLGGLAAQPVSAEDDSNDLEGNAGTENDVVDVFSDVTDVEESVEFNTLAADPQPPQSAEYALYFRDDGNLYKQNDAGNASAVGGGASGAGAMAPTFTVAASDAQSQAGADYVCDGTNDEVQINQAISDLPPVGGSIALTEGTFNISAPIGDPASAQRDQVLLSGNGIEATTLEVQAQTNCFELHDPQGWTIRDLEIDGNKSANGDGGNRENQVGIYVHTGANFYLQSTYIHDTTYSSFRAANDEGNGEGRNFRLINNRFGATKPDASDTVADHISFAGRFTSGATYRGGIVGNNLMEDCGHQSIEIGYCEGFVSKSNAIYNGGGTNPSSLAISHHDSSTGATPPSQAQVIQGNVVVGQKVGGNAVINAEGPEIQVSNNVVWEPRDAETGIKTVERPGDVQTQIISNNQVAGGGNITKAGYEISTDNTICVGNTSRGLASGATASILINRGNGSIVVANYATDGIVDNGGTTAPAIIDLNQT